MKKLAVTFALLATAAPLTACAPDMTDRFRYSATPAPDWASKIKVLSISKYECTFKDALGETIEASDEGENLDNRFTVSLGYRYQCEVIEKATGTMCRWDSALGTETPRICYTQRPEYTAHMALQKSQPKTP